MIHFSSEKLTADLVMMEYETATIKVFRFPSKQD